MNRKILFSAFLLCFLKPSHEIYEFHKDAQSSYTQDELSILSKIEPSEQLQAINLALQSANRLKRLEQNLIKSNHVVVNGSLSHALLLEELPNKEAIEADRVARTILKASSYVLNNDCRRSGLTDKTCANYLSETALPNSELKTKCESLLENRKKSTESTAFRRLLNASYKDGLYKMDQRLPKPRFVAERLSEPADFAALENHATDEKRRNLVLIQFTQFIEHDLSKSVVTTLENGAYIECCAKDFINLLPRYTHPECAPLELESDNSYGPNSCLNYVRGSLALNKDCNFGPALQFNQATNSLDLSQLYGHDIDSKSSMRSYSGGRLKISYDKENRHMLPLAEMSSNFCVNANSQAGSCYMAGDSRVNSNPYMTSIYTLFLRSHNEITERLEREHTDWDDERLFNEARKQNINLYRSIVYNEWLPAALGKDIADSINTEKTAHVMKKSTDDDGVSNEFAVAAIRFYYSMMPEILHRTKNRSEENSVDANIRRNWTFNNLLAGSSILQELCLDMGLKEYIDRALGKSYEAGGEGNVSHWMAASLFMSEKFIKSDSKSLKSRTHCTAFLVSNSDWKISFRRYEKGLVVSFLHEPNNSDRQILFKLKDSFYQRGVLDSSEELDAMLEAMTRQSSLQMDVSYVNDVTKYFLYTGEEPMADNRISGANALAYDIQRGRDFGVAGYIHYLRQCQKTNRILKWEDLLKYIPESNLERLRSVYQTIESIDLIVGGVSERPLSESVVGPTFTCILGEQFSNIRRKQSFEEGWTAPLSTTENNSFARKLLCNTANLTAVPANVFLTPSNMNPLINC